MANRRMFSRDVLLSDDFTALDPALRCLYVTLGMEADDDGFLASPLRIARAEGLGEPALEELERRGYLIRFPSGVAALRHWKLNNLLRSDRHKDTVYQAELALLEQDGSGRYQLVDKRLSDGSPSIDQERKEEDRSEQNNAREGGEAETNPAAREAGRDGADTELSGLLEEYEALRRELGKPLNDCTRRILKKKLESFPREERAEVLRQSLFHRWADLYPLSARRSGAPPGEEAPRTIDMERLRRSAAAL